ncbi:unnamed protein product [Ixodes persulcatus]
MRPISLSASSKVGMLVPEKGGNWEKKKKKKKKKRSHAFFFFTFFLAKALENTSHGTPMCSRGRVSRMFCAHHTVTQREVLCRNSSKHFFFFFSSTPLRQHTNTK